MCHKRLATDTTLKLNGACPHSIELTHAAVQKRLLDTRENQFRSRPLLLTKVHRLVAKNLICCIKPLIRPLQKLFGAQVEIERATGIKMLCHIGKIGVLSLRQFKG